MKSRRIFIASRITIFERGSGFPAGFAFRQILQLLQGLLKNDKNQNSYYWSENLLANQASRASSLSPQYFLGTIIVRVLNPARLLYQPPAALAALVSNANCFELDRRLILKMPIVRL